MTIAREARRPPRELAEALAAAYPPDPERFAGVEVAGAGFLNFRYADGWLAALPSRIGAAGEAYGDSDAGRGEKVLVEYVSANPTGPMNVVSARAAAVGSTLVRLLAATGHDAAGEFYVNDAGNQVDLLGRVGRRALRRTRGCRPLDARRRLPGCLPARDRTLHR